ncbi:MAG: RagB/SusD family nutrient uptake outer membrane protein [Bacteroidales bacterium]|nr:RagB/SusD family nutrient uptake outer membrane protein [Bacteroidales bacterium]
MKTRNILASAVFSGLLLNSCNLDYNATSAIAETNLTENDYKYLLIGVYNGVQQFSMGHLYYIDEICADGLDDNSYYDTENSNRIVASDSSINSWWNTLYKGIQLANNLVNLIEQKADKTEADIEMQAEARVLRAWLYSRVATFWGDAPILLEVKDEQVPRNTEKEVWEQVVADLEFGIANAPDYQDNNHVSKTAAKALLARVLTIVPQVQDKARGAQLAEEVIADGRFELADNFADIWQSKTSKEIILEWNNTTTDSSGIGWFLRSNIVTDYENSNGSGSAGYGEMGRYTFPVDIAQYNAYSDKDNRKASSVRHLVLGSAETYDCVKYPRYDGADPWPIIRMGELYLISAEAQGYPAGITRLNQLREKRGLDALTAGTDINADNFLQKIIEERRLELFVEGSRWYDLRRLWNSGAAGKQAVLDLRTLQPGETSRPGASQSMDIAEDGYNLLWPVPQTAIDNDPMLLPQNPGY